jgi:hypothetical protein
MKAIVVLLDKENSQDWHDVRCVQCGRKFCNVNREITAIQLNAPTGHEVIVNADIPAVEIKCRGCDAIYSLLIQ